jgi:hypothetical protein
MRRKAQVSSLAVSHVSDILLWPAVGSYVPIRRVAYLRSRQCRVFPPALDASPGHGPRIPLTTTNRPATAAHHRHTATTPSMNPPHRPPRGSRRRQPLPTRCNLPCTSLRRILSKRRCSPELALAPPGALERSRRAAVRDPRRLLWACVPRSFCSGHAPGNYQTCVSCSGRP